jgi:hypothetical protein
VVLGDVQGIKPGLVGRRREFNPLVEKLRERPFTVFDVVEKSRSSWMLPTLLAGSLVDHVTPVPRVSI